MFQYFQIFRRERPDIVFNYTIKPNIYSSIAAKWCGSKVICMVAGLGYMFEGSGLIKKLGLKLYKYGLNMAEKVLVLNKMNYDKLKDSHIVSTDKLILLKGGEGVNLNAYPYQPSDYTSGVTFLMIARVLYDKGYVNYLKEYGLKEKLSMTDTKASIGLYYYSTFYGWYIYSNDDKGKKSTLSHTIGDFDGALSIAKNIYSSHLKKEYGKRL